MSTPAIKPPTRSQRFTLRLMIILGLVGMFFFLKTILQSAAIGNPFLYYMLLSSIIFACLTTLHEWYHYYHITVPDTPPTERVYTVDIFTTFCAGEPYEMIEETLLAIKSITYPHETYLCDEANDPYLVDLCARLGVHHVTRIVKIDAKAGNINNALKLSNGELCVVLDPDHVPFPNFLDPIVSHFQDPEIGFVQVVQAYKNHNHGLIAKGAAQQTYQFYGPMMMTMNKYGTVLAIGANCTFRRAALESIGGHAAGLAEDMHTAMQLHARGWKSVYVPEVLARGLVPSTLSAYYSQQLKWSRGVFELLVATYPKLYKNFTWHQKLHYLTIPFHYLSGIFFLINFLIPIVALTFSVSPLTIDIGQVFVIWIPFLAAILLIRHFVQWWVMEDDERGFHVVGGLLMIGTWWIYIIGLFYTVLRKKVPYNPTPKDGNEANNWPLNIPNLIVVGLSVFAIIYGLYNDYNPYNLLMAGFAGLNCMILLFTVAASRQLQFRVLKSKYRLLEQVVYRLHLLKKSFWLLRRKVYTGVRSTALLITVLIICLIGYTVNDSENEPEQIPAFKRDYQLMYGIYSPTGSEGLSSVNRIEKEQRIFKAHFDLISLYIPWSDDPGFPFPTATIDSIYKNGSIPMITWEPWQSLFVKEKRNEFHQEKQVLKKIVRGEFDDYLNDFATKIRSLKRPVYIRFAHEADNPFYPWSGKGGNSAEDFKSAWRYVHHFFSKNGAINAIWVWNPWKAEAAGSFFPGRKYVDWIGVTNLNYGIKAAGAKWMSMEELYRPFHNHPIFKTGIPVMLAEMGSAKSAGHQKKWLDDAIKSVKLKFPEINAVVLFNNGYDVNVPSAGSLPYVDWTVQDAASVLQLFKFNDKKSSKIGELSTMKSAMLETGIKPAKDFEHTAGVNYAKGLDWYKSDHPFGSRELREDFTAIKMMGLNSVRRYGPSIYDHNILKTARKTGLKIAYCFWIPEDVNFVKDEDRLKALTDEIAGTIKRFKNNKEIISWTIGNTSFQKLKQWSIKPGLLYQEDGYLIWLRNLVNKIQQIDSTRSIHVELKLSEDCLGVGRRILRSVPGISSFALLIDENGSDKVIADQLAKLDFRYHFAQVEPNVLRMSSYPQSSGFFVTNWQDVTTQNWVKLNGLNDLNGRHKSNYYDLKEYLRKPVARPKFPEIRILKPAKSTETGSVLRYNAVLKTGKRWTLSQGSEGLSYEWKLVKTSPSGTPVSIKRVGIGPFLDLKIPVGANSYRLYLYIMKGSAVKLTTASLNTPLYESEKILKY